MSRYTLKKWKNCTRCGLHKFRRKIVFGRGDVPADILLIGEAPGKSENMIGKAFIGRSGKLLDLGILRAMEMAHLSEKPSMFISNVIACRPTEEKNGDNREPTGEEAWACWPRLEQTYFDVNPKEVVFLGRVAERFCKQPFPDGTHLVHPAFILRQGGQASTYFRTFCRGLSEVFRKVSKRRVRRIT